MPRSQTILIHQPIGRFIGNHQYLEQVGLLWSRKASQVRIISDFRGDQSALSYHPVYEGVFDQKYKIAKFVRFFLASLRSVILIFKLKPEILNIHIFDMKITDVIFLVIVKAVSEVDILITVHDVSNISGKSRIRGLIEYLKPFFFSRAKYLNVHTEFSENQLKQFFIKKNIRFNEKFLIFSAPDYIGASGARGAVTDSHVVSDSKVNFLVFGQVKASKRLDLVIEAAWRLRHRNDWHLTIRGKLRDFKLEEYQKKLKELEASGHCDYQFGFINEGELEPILQTTDVALLPYDNIYNSGVLINMLARSIPCLTSDHPVFVASSRYGRLNMLHRQGDSEDLAQRMVEFLEFGNLGYAKDRASEIFASEFSVTAVTEQFEKSFTSVFT